MCGRGGSAKYVVFFMDFTSHPCAGVRPPHRAAAALDAQAPGGKRGL